MAAAALTLLVLLLAACLPVQGQTMDRSAGGMTMRPDGPGGMWGTLERDGAGLGRGERLFRAGRLPGDRTAAAERNGNPVGPDQVACANCHGRSGQGIREGGQNGLPVNAEALFRPRTGTPARPAYDDATLARALEAGIDAGGQPLGVLMPRYRLAADDLAALTGYLHGLSGTWAQGVAKENVQIATVLAGDVDPARRAALLSTLQGYAEDLAGRPAGTGRHWQLQSWTLTGTPTERRAHLEAEFARHPVAALIGGLGDDSWLAVHQFCEQHTLACLFPDTDLPPSDPGAFHSVYLDRGRALTGQLLARHLMDHPELLAGGPLVQVLPDNWKGYVPASALRALLGRAAARKVRDLTVGSGEAMGEAFWRQVLTREHPAALAIWARRADLAALARTLDGQPALPVFLPMEDLPAMAAPDGKATAIPGLALQVLARAVPGRASPDLAAWHDFQSRHRLPPGQEAGCADAWFAARVLEDALADQPGDRVDVDRLMARVEYATGTVVSHPLRPGLALGMGQRFAGKAGWLLRPDAAAGGLQVQEGPITP